MFKNYFIVARRNLMRYKSFSLINIAGLAVGMACCILILQYIRYELSYDRQHTKANHIYRVLRETQQTDGQSNFTWGVSGPLASAMQEEIPEVEQVVRKWHHSIGIKYGDRHLKATFALVDATFFKIFDFPMVSNADPISTLKQPGRILLTERNVKRFFGNEDPIGKTISIHGSLSEGDYVIAGVLKDYDSNTTMGFDFITTHLPNVRYVNELWDEWIPGSWRMTQVYALLHKGANVKEVEAKLAHIMSRDLGPKVTQTDRYRLQSLPRTRLYSGADFGMRSDQSIEQIYMLGTVAALVIVIACINFVNLSTARASKRTQEVGTRKVFGAHRSQLMRQFMIEAILIALLSAGFAIQLAQLMLPSFNALLQLNLNLGLDLLPYLIGLAIIVGILAGSYPALYLSRFQPAQALNGGTGPKKAEFLRRGLVVLQFTVSIILIVGVW